MNGVTARKRLAAVGHVYDNGKFDRVLATNAVQAISNELMKNAH